MGRWRGTTTERGVGASHQADKRRLLALFRDGDLCLQRFPDGGVCGQPMFRWQELDRGHLIDRVFGGADGPAFLVHAHCNRSAGAILGNQLAGRTWAPRPRSTPRDTRTCPICGAGYSPSRSDQVTCGRTCGWDWRRLHEGKPVPSPRPRPSARRW